MACYRVVQSYGTEPLTFEGSVLVGPVLLEDDDGRRIFLVDDTLTKAELAAAVRAGAEVLAMPNGDGMRFTIMKSPGQRWHGVPNVCSVASLHAWAEAAEQPRDFVHLHAHSMFSALDGLSTIEEMVDRAVADQQPALAVTDHGVCAAHPHLQIVADKAGIQPIFGIEANFVDDRHAREDLFGYKHLILWAMDNDGLRNLWAMSTEANREGFYGRPRLDWDTLERFQAGVMASTACLRGPVAIPLRDDRDDEAKAVMARLLQIFPGRLYAEVHTTQSEEQRKVNAGTIEIADSLGVPLIAVTDSHYPCFEDRQTHQIWIAAQTNKDLQDDKDLFSEDDSHYHLMTRDEVARSLKYLPEHVVEEAITNTVGVAQRCSARLVSKSAAPVFSKEGGKRRDAERLMAIIAEAWKVKIAGKPNEAVYVKRAEKELRLIIGQDFAGYFLMIHSTTTWAREHGVLIGPGRGSGAGCLIAWLCDITSIDPIEYDLMFERFMTEGRKALPDFDIDYPSSKVGMIQEHEREQYGEDHVMRVGTMVRSRNKGIVRTLARILTDVYDLDWRDINEVANLITEAERSSAGLGIPWEDLWEQHGEVLNPFREKYPEFFDLADKMVGRVTSYGQHAAGTVISIGEPIIDRLPMRIAGPEKERVMVADFDMRALEFLGYPKNDNLALRNLDTLQSCIDQVKERYGIVIDPVHWVDEYHDPMMWEEIGNGHTLGIFQVDGSAGGTRLCKQLKPQSVHDLADIDTLVRPGPTRSGLTAAYLKRRAGEETVTYPDERLREVLEPTYGCMIYQEQIMAACQLLAGYSLTEADEVRSILGKKKVELVAAERARFLPAAIANGMREVDAERIWDQMAEFARYTFNKAHAVSYAQLGCWTAWFKVNYPRQFLVAVLSTVEKGRIPDFVNEARRMGYEVLPPDINESGKGFSATELVVRYGLDSVKHVGDVAVADIIAGQPYTSWQDFLDRRGPKCNMGVVRTLAPIGAFDSLVPNRRSLERWLEWEETGLLDRCTHWNPETYATKKEVPEGVCPADADHPCSYDWVNEPATIGKSGRPLKKKDPPKRCSKSCRHYSPPDRSGFPDIAPYSAGEIRARESETLGVYLSSTPFDFLEEMKPGFLDNFASADEIETTFEPQVGIIGIVNKARTYVVPSSMKEMAFVSLHLRDGADIDVTVFPRQWASLCEVLEPGDIVMATVAKNERGLSLTSKYEIISHTDVAKR